VRFASLDKLAVDVVAEALSRVSVDAYVATYRATRPTPARSGKVAPAKKPRRRAASSR